MCRTFHRPAAAGGALMRRATLPGTGRCCSASPVMSRRRSGLPGCSSRASPLPRHPPASYRRMTTLIRSVPLQQYACFTPWTVCRQQQLLSSPLGQVGRSRIRDLNLNGPMLLCPVSLRVVLAGCHMYAAGWQPALAAVGAPAHAPLLTWELGLRMAWQPTLASCLPSSQLNPPSTHYPCLGCKHTFPSPGAVVARRPPQHSRSSHCREPGAPRVPRHHLGSRGLPPAAASGQLGAAAGAVQPGGSCCGRQVAAR